MKKTIALLTILMLVVFMVGCENSINPTEPQTQNEKDGISLAKKGSGDIATFKIAFSGGVIGGDATWENQVLRKGAKMISAPPHQYFPMTFNGVSNCLEVGDKEYSAPYFMIQRHDRKNPELARVMIWFDGPGMEGVTLTYVLILDGEFEVGKQWPPAVDNSNTITIDSWELGTQGNPKKYKAKPCESEDFPSGSASDPGSDYITVMVTRIS